MEQARSFCTENHADLGFQQRYIRDYRLPDDVQIKRKIFVRDIVSETLNRVPGDIWKAAFEGRRKSRGRFADDKELMQKTAL